MLGQPCRTKQHLEVTFVLSIWLFFISLETGENWLCFSSPLCHIFNLLEQICRNSRGLIKIISSTMDVCVGSQLPRRFLPISFIYSLFHRQCADKEGSENDANYKNSLTFTYILANTAFNKKVKMYRSFIAAAKVKF